jgi:hypothetical protein
MQAGGAVFLPAPAAGYLEDRMSIHRDGRQLAIPSG